MEINKSINCRDYLEFMAMLEKVKKTGVPFSFSGNVNEGNDGDNFSINWTSEEEEI